MQLANLNRRIFLGACADRLAKNLFRANLAARVCQRVGRLDDLRCSDHIIRSDHRDEFGDVDVCRTRLHTWSVETLQAALSFSLRLLGSHNIRGGSGKSFGFGVVSFE